jgi:hypothetical protein
MQKIQRIGTRNTEENKESACEELKQSAYSKIVLSLIVIPPDDLSNKSRYKIQSPLITDALPGNTPQYNIYCKSQGPVRNANLSGYVTNRVYKIRS